MKATDILRSARLVPHPEYYSGRSATISDLDHIKLERIWLFVAAVLRLGAGNWERIHPEGAVFALGVRNDTPAIRNPFLREHAQELDHRRTVQKGA